MRVLLDECVHAGVRAAFPGHLVKTVTESGWRSVQDGQLLIYAAKQFDVFVTIDSRIEFQNALHKFSLGFVIARVRSNRLCDFAPIFPELLTAALAVRPGEVLHVGAPRVSR